MVLLAKPEHAWARRLKLEVLHRARMPAPVEPLAERPALPPAGGEFGAAAEARAGSATLMAQPREEPGAARHDRRAWIARIKALAAGPSRDDLLPALEAARAAFPEDRWLAARHAAALRDGGRAADAVAILALLHDADGTNLDIMTELGRARLASGDAAAGIALLDDVLVANPGARAAWAARLDAMEAEADATALAALCRRLHAVILARQDKVAAGRLAQLLPRLDLAHWNSETWAWIEAVAANPAEVSPRALWTLYELAELCGLTQPCERLLAALLDKPVLPLSLATRLLRWSRAISEAHWEWLMPRLRQRVPDSHAPLFDLHCDALAHGAGEALRRRRRRPGRDTEEILLLFGLLMQDSKVDQAMRYLVMARRFHPEDRRLLNCHLKEMVATGQAEAARVEVARLLSGPEATRMEDRRIAISVLIALGEARQALDLIDATEDRAARQDLLKKHAHLLLRFGRPDQARAVVRAAATLSNARRSMHSNATQGGAALAELALAEAGQQGAAAAARTENGFQLVGPSVRALDAYLAAAPPPVFDAHGAIPRRIMQYWSQGEPPPELARIMRGWAEAEGFSYARFDRRGASRFLAEELGPDWASALRLARHPAEESDFFRLCWLVVRGGIYADCDDWLIGSPDDLIAGARGLVVFRESRGTIANNLLLAEPAHPVLAHAAVAAKQALLRLDNDSIWAKTGPGLLTRAVADACERAAAENADPGVVIRPFHEAGRHVRSHVALDYKKTARYWNASSHGRHLPRFATPLPEEG